MDEIQLNFALAAKVDFLRRAESYPEGPRHVELIETHMSCVFLADAYVYKLKKPVRYEFLDFSTPELRRLDCEGEVELNRRLAPDVYLGVVALTLAAGGRMEIGGSGEPIDWLVKMRRLESARMLDHAIRAGTLHEGDVHGAAALLSKFYAAAPRVEMDAAAYARRFEEDVELNRREMIAYGLPADDVDFVSAVQAALLENERDLIEGRARGGHIIEAHGDLRPEHIYLGPPPAVIDCLEFNRDFRILDPVDEISFLAMECDRLGAGSVGERVLSAYAEASGDRPAEQLALFYKCFRACLRARIMLWHLRDSAVRDPVKWPRLARGYLTLAGAYARRLPRSHQLLRSG